MLTVDFERLGAAAGETLLDLGSGSGRHSAEAALRGLYAVAVDIDSRPLREAIQRFDETPGVGGASVVAGDGARLPFPDAAFDRVIASEILEHVRDDSGVMREIVRVLRPGGTIAVTVPRWWVELVCWGLSRRYRTKAGGHVRIYRRRQLVGRLEGAGLRSRGTHHAHALHSPYWWLKCIVGVDDDDAFLARMYHRFLVWDLLRRPRWTGVLESWLDPVLGKSLVVYLAKHDASAEVSRAA